LAEIEAGHQSNQNIWRLAGLECPRDIVTIQQDDQRRASGVPGIGDLNQNVTAADTVWLG